MIFKQIKKIDYREIQRFANIYGFPYDDALIEIFYNINGSKPIGFDFLYKDETGEMNTCAVQKILSFNMNDDNSVEGAIEEINCESNVFPIALDENENYICYIGDNDAGEIKLFDATTCEYIDIYTETGELYTPRLFFSDLET